MAPNLSKFNKTLNTTFVDLRTQLTNQTNHFATAQATTGTDPVYAMFQCRNYISELSQICKHSSPTKPTTLPRRKQPLEQICATCFAVSITKIRNCSPSFSPFSNSVEVQRGRVGVVEREKREMEFQREIESGGEEEKEKGSRFNPK